jgi:transcriptional regulator with XRE-family HTH domain
MTARADDNECMSETKWYDRARKALRESGVTFEEVATATGVTRPAVGHWLSGRREPSVDELRTIARMAGLSLDQMCGDDPRFLTSALDKELFDAARELDEEAKRVLLATARALAKPSPR